MATKNNWFTTTLNNRNKDNLCDFDINMVPYEFKSGKFTDEAARVAHELVEKNDNLHICYSGGLDSEFVLNTFLKESLPITPILIDTPYNQVELEWAHNFCKEKNVKFEILTYTKNEIVDKMKEKTIDRGLFALLGGLPLVVCDEVNKVSGKLITGYGDPFEVHSGIQPNNPIPTNLCFSEWDYYLDSYDNTHPSGFFTYDLGLFYSLITQIDYNCKLQESKSKLYGLKERQKMFWEDEFYSIFREIKLNIEHYDCSIPRDQVLNDLNISNLNIQY